MAGQIIKRGENRWLVSVFLGLGTSTRTYRGKPVEGLTKKFATRTVHGTKREAQRVLTALLRERDQGIRIEPSRVTLNDWLDRWLSDIARERVRATTFAEYEALLRRYVRTTIGLQPLSKLTPEAIQALYGDMRRRDLSARTVRYLHAVLGSALGHAVRTRRLPFNPASAVELPRQTRNEMKVLTAEQVRTLLSRARSTREYPLFLLAVTTGLRPSEYFGLKWSDLAGDQLSVQRSLTRRGAAWSIEETKRAGSRRNVSLAATVVEALKVHKVALATERLAAGADWKDQGFIFPDPTGAPERLRTIVGRFKRLLRAKCSACEGNGDRAACSACKGRGTQRDLPDVRLYDLRHCAATLALAAGTSAKLVSDQLGHASVGFTLSVYAHVLPGQQETAAAAIDALLFGTVSR